MLEAIKVRAVSYGILLVIGAWLLAAIGFTVWANISPEFHKASSLSLWLSVYSASSLVLAGYVAARQAEHAAVMHGLLVGVVATLFFVALVLTTSKFFNIWQPHGWALLLGILGMLVGVVTLTVLGSLIRKLERGLRKT